MKDFFKSLFSASSKEITGFSALIIILLISLLIPKAVSSLTNVNDSHSREDELMLDSLVVLLEKQQRNSKVAVKKPVNPHPFDPNHEPYAALQMLGFSDRIAQRIVNYREKGGVFKIRNDLYKIYDIDTSLVDELYNYIDLPDNLPDAEVTKKPKKERHTKPEYKVKETPVELPVFDINVADTATLQTIKGIGSVLSRRIVDFRDKLGGFRKEGQLYEVYNLDSAVVVELLAKMYIEPDFVPRKLLINSVGEDELAGHPYITWQQARLIIAYRNQHGDYNSTEDLLKVYAIGEDDISRIDSYLDWAASN